MGIPIQVLTAATALNKSFSTSIPGLQTAWDSTSLGALKTCPRLYFYKIILGLQSRKMAEPLQFGIWLHEFLEYYDFAKCDGATHAEAVHDTIWHVLKETTELVPQTDPLGNPAFNEDGTPSLHRVFWAPEDKRRTRYALVRALVWYFDKYPEDPAKTVILANGKPAVELSFKFPLEMPRLDDVLHSYLLCGHIDRMVEFADMIYVMDHKTSGYNLSSKYFDQFTPSNQMSLYALAGKIIYHRPVEGVIINGIQLAVGFNRFSRGFAPRTAEQLDEFYEDTKVWIKQAESFATQAHWPMNEESCSKYGGCDFRHICSKSPVVRETFINADFHTRIWDPLTPRN